MKTIADTLNERSGPAASRGRPEVSPPSQTDEILPDAEQVEQMRARSLLELAGAHLRQALKFPEEIETLRSMVAELLLENGFLRHDMRRLADRVEALEKRTEVSR